MAIHTPHGFTISDKNEKMDDIHSFSVVARTTCKADVPCMRNCYACRMYNTKRNIRESHTRNYDLLRNGGWGDFVNDIVGFIRYYGVKLFRFNVAGDIWDVRYSEAIWWIARLCPETKFLLFTKQYDNIEDTRLDHCGEFPENLAVYLSVWGDYKPSKWIDTRKYHIAYYQDSKESYDVDPDAFVCREHCRGCMHCFKGAGNVVFHQH